MKGLPTIVILCLWANLALAGKMYVTDRGASLVRSANLDGTDLQTLIPSAGSNIRGIAIDISSDDLFYADNGADIIYRARLNGSGRAAIVDTLLGFPADIALDRQGGKVYWCDRNNNRIERANYDGTGRETVTATTQPYYLDLDLTHGKIYWGDFSGGNIFRADLPDASNLETVVDTNIQTRGVKVDPGGGYFYWCDREAHKVQRRPIDGGPIEDLYTGLDTPHGMTLDIPAGKVYWVDTGTNNVVGSTGARAINRGDMDGSGAQEVLANVTQPWDITLDTTVTTYDAWVARRFSTLLPPGASLLTADLESDGNNNLLEYFADLDPFRADPYPTVTYFKVSGEVLIGYRQTFEPITDVIASVEVATDLAAWASGPAVSEYHTTGFTDGPAQMVVHRPLPAAVDPLGTQMRLRLQLIAP